MLLDQLKGKMALGRQFVSLSVLWITVGSGTLFSYLTSQCSAQVSGQNAGQTVPSQEQTRERSDGETPSFTFRVTTSIVIVDVVVRDKEDNPVRDLSASDLQVSEKIGELAAISEKIASFRPVNEATARQSTRTNGIVLGWLHKSFCPLTGAYELSYYLAPESRKDGLHRISVTSSRPGLRVFFRPGYKIEADKPATVEAGEFADKPSDAELQKMQLLEAERKKHPELELARIACYDTMNLTNFDLHVRKVESRPSVDAFEFLVPGSYFASLSSVEHSYATQLDFSLCTFESGGHPVHHFEGTVQVGSNTADFPSLTTRGFAHTVNVEREGCRMEARNLVCNPPLSIGEMSQQTVTTVLSARLVVRDRNTGAMGSGEVLLGALSPDQFSSPIPEGLTNESFGTPNPATRLAMCGDVYQLAPWTINLPLFSELDALAPLYSTSLAVRSRFFTTGIPGVSSRTEWFGVNYQGTFGVDRPGKYEFDLLSDDGAKVYVDDKLVVSDDTIHPTQRSRGKLALGLGAHTIRVSYFQGPRTEVSLVFLVKPPGRNWRLFDTRDLPSPEEPALQRNKLPLPRE